MDKQNLDELLATMVRAGASSLHLIPGRPPCVRVQRRFLVSEVAPVSASDIEELTRDFLFEDHRVRLQLSGHVEVLFVSRNGQRFRTTVMQQGTGLSMLMRPVAARPARLDELELPQQIGGFTRFRSGLVVVTGFFGAGKSTTLAAMVDKINQETTRNVVTLEDPIECLHPPAQALLHQREVGVHVDTFANGIKQAVRVGADVIAVADLDDAATLDAALTAVESGCLVLAAFEASSVVGACQELPHLLPFEQRPRTRMRLAMCLRAMAAQTLLPRSHNQGRVALVEILLSNASVRLAIRNNQAQELPDVMARCRGLGMQTADIALRNLLARHLITPEEAQHHASNRDLVLGRQSPAPHAGTH
jgi:twitching motility protein PilT